jgi:hypothetical protein
LLRKAVYQRLDHDLNVNIKQGYVSDTPDDDLFATIIFDSSFGLGSNTGFIPITIWVYSSGQDYIVLDELINEIKNILSPEFENPLTNQKITCKLDTIGPDSENNNIDCISKFVSFYIPVSL